MMAKGKAVEVVVVAAVAVAAEGKKQWLGICHKENLIALVITTAIMATAATVEILAVVVMVQV